MPEAPPAPTASFWTSLRYFSIGRLVLSTLLLLPVLLGDHARWVDVVVDEALYVRTAFAYLGLAFALLAVASRWRRGFQAQLTIQVLVDLSALVLLMHAAGGPRSGLGVLTVAAVAGAAVLSTSRGAAVSAALAALMLLAESAWRAIGQPSAEPAGFFAAGVIGAACFVTAAVVNRLAARLAAQEALARARGVDLQGQLALTRLVVEQLAQGVVVFGADARVRAMNPAAQALFAGAGQDDALARVLRVAQAGGGDPDGVETSLDAPGSEAARRVRLRVLRPEGVALGDTVVVIDDLRELEDRARQLKLASMGRLSASIAHEIRNPLSAIRHANGLLAEQLQDVRLQRLARIVEDNTVRIDRVVQDVLSVARRERPAQEPVDLARFLETLLPELVLTAGADRRRIAVELEAREPILFDPGQLRQVLVNLLGNALRYASRAPGAVRIQWRRGMGDRLELRVSDDGPGLAPGMIEHVFEPFFTTESRGTGLGLFLAREFCAANGAALRYEPAAGDDAERRSAFVIHPVEPGPA